VPDLRGTGLTRVLFAYTDEDPGMVDGYHEVLQPLPAKWARGLGIAEGVIAKPKKTMLPDRVEEGADYSGADPVALSTRNSRVTQLDMRDDEAAARVRVYEFDHAGHFWPNPVQDRESWILNRWGFRSQDFDAADVVWEFFREGATGAD
jgi:hypothetical protein